MTNYINHGFVHGTFIVTNICIKLNRSTNLFRLNGSLILKIEKILNKLNELGTHFCL